MWVVLEHPKNMYTSQPCNHSRPADFVARLSSGLIADLFNACFEHWPHVRSERLWIDALVDMLFL